MLIPNQTLSWAPTLLTYLAHTSLSPWPAQPTPHTHEHSLAPAPTRLPLPSALCRHQPNMCAPAQPARQPSSLVAAHASSPCAADHPTPPVSAPPWFLFLLTPLARADAVCSTPSRPRRVLPSLLHDKAPQPPRLRVAMPAIDAH